MRYVTLVLYPDPNLLHPVEQRLAEDPEVTRKAIHSVKELDDGSIALLAEVAGDLDRYREIMQTSSVVHEYAVSGDESGYCYSRVDSTPMTRKLMGSHQAEEFIMQMPIQYTEDGGQRVTLVGQEADFVGRPFELPDDVEVELESTGPYYPDAEGILSTLTDRQQEILEVAIRLGYYETPRQVTLDDIAADVGVESGTVGKHLRNVESKVFSEFIL